MGNTHTPRAVGQHDIHSYLQNDIPYSFKNPLSKSKFLRSSKCEGEDGVFVVKLYIKDSERQDLLVYQDLLLEICSRFSLQKTPNVIPYRSVLTSDRFPVGYLVRQHFHSTLANRLSSRPFYSTSEKLWMSYQALKAVEQLHSCSVCHGDIKTENFVLLSWNWLFITDLAPFKPTYFSEEDAVLVNPFYFDCSGRDRCYIAPERVLRKDILAHPDCSTTERVSDISDFVNEPLVPSMDVFSLGCTLAEIFIDRPLFDLSSLLRYRNGDYSPVSLYQGTPLEPLITHMIQLDPSQRHSISSYLQEFESLFPSYFPKLYDLMKELFITEKNSDRFIQFLCDHNDTIVKTIFGSSEPSPVKESFAFLDPETLDVPDMDEGDSYTHRFYHAFGNEQTRFSRLIEEVQSISRMEPGRRASASVTSASLDVPVLSTPNPSMTVNDPPKPVLEQVLFFLAIATSSIRSCRYPQSRMSGLSLIVEYGKYCTDEWKLQRIVPYLLTLLNKEENSLVKSFGIEALVFVLQSIKLYPLTEGTIYNDYLLPLISSLANESQDDLTKMSVAANIGTIAALSKKALCDYYEQYYRSLVQKDEGLPKLVQCNYDKDLGNLRSSIKDLIATKLLSQYYVNTYTTYIGVMNALPELCDFFDGQITDLLLEHLISCLNLSNPIVNALFYRHLDSIWCVISKEEKQLLLPCIESSLTEQPDFVAFEVIDSLVRLVSRDEMEYEYLQLLNASILPYLLSSQSTLRELVVCYLISVSSFIGTSSTLSDLVPVIQKYFTEPLIRWKWTEEVLQSLLKPPYSPSMPLLSDANADGPLYSFLDKRRKKLSVPSSNYAPQDSEPVLTNPVSFPSSSMKAIRERSLYVPSTQNSEFSRDLVIRRGSTALRRNSMDTSLPSPADFRISVFPNRPSNQPQTFKDIEPFITTRLEKCVIALNPPAIPPKLAYLNTSMDSRRGAASMTYTEFDPDGYLFKTLKEHTGSINCLSMSGNGSVMVSGGDDGSIRVWNSVNILDQVDYHSLSVFKGLGRITGVEFLERSRSIVTSSDSGMVQLFSILNGPSKLEDSSLSLIYRHDPGEGHYSTNTSHVILYGTQSNTVHGVDLRDFNLTAFHLPHSLELGYLTSLSVGPDQMWCVSGTSDGYLSLWDLRYQRMVKLFHHEEGQRINRLFPVAWPYRAGHSPLARSNPPAHPTCWVATGKNECSAFNLNSGDLLQTLRSIPEVITEEDAFHHSKLAPIKFSGNPMDPLRSLPPPVVPASRYPQVRAIAIPTVQRRLSTSTILTGGDDNQVHCWNMDTEYPGQSFIQPLPGELHHSYASYPDKLVILCQDRNNCITNDIKHPSAEGKIFNSIASHMDSVTDIVINPLTNVVFSSSRDGVIKAWK